MIGTGFGMFLAFALLMTHLRPSTRRRIVGYALLVDVITWATCLYVFGGTGAERLGAIGASIGITFGLHLYRWGWGYEKLQRGRWVRYAGRFT